MRYQSKARVMVFLASCSCLLLSFLPDGHASRASISIQPELSKTVLRMAGLECEIVDLHREDGFDRALYTDTIGSATILIGFPITGIRKGVPFLLAVDGEEIVVRIAEDGRLEVVAGNASVMPAGIIESVECLLDTLVDLIQGVLDASLNPFSIIALVLNAVFRIIGCVFSLII